MGVKECEAKTRDEDSSEEETKVVSDDQFDELVKFTKEYLCYPSF